MFFHKLKPISVTGHLRSCYSLSIGDFVSFDTNDSILVRVLNIKRGYFLYRSSTDDESLVWERIEYIVHIYHFLPSS